MFRDKSRRLTIGVGQSVGNYTILSKLGEGGMGTVFLAEHPVIGRKVALKVILPEFARDTEMLSRFVNEAKSVSQIGHRHIVDVTDFGNTLHGDFYFMMEYLLGDNLSDIIKREGRLPAERAVRIAAQIADALQAAHEHGVVHRDLKPENVILIAREDDEDFVKVLDFGLAKLTRAADKAPGHKTRAGSVMGTPCYMAPEQCEGTVEIDHRADIYALGVIFFEMLTGKVPFGGSGFGEIMMKQMTTPPPSIRSIVRELSPALDQISFRALSKNANERFQTMAELRRALLDPDSFASTVTTKASFDDPSARVRAAQPMARVEMNLIPSEPLALPSMGRKQTDRQDSTFGLNAGQRNGASHARDLVPKRSHGPAVVVALGVLVAVVIAGSKFRGQARALFVSAMADSTPATVRLNFSSDPDGATVTRADGAVLGITPLSTDVPFGNVGLGYMVSKQGYLPKKLAAVPNLAAPLFAILERDPLNAAIEPLAAAQPTDANHGAAARAAVASRVGVLQPARQRPAADEAPTGDTAVDPTEPLSAPAVVAPPP